MTRLDVLVSALISSTPIGPIEPLLLLPAHAFGSPLCALGCLPCWLPLLAGGRDAAAIGLAAASTLITAALPLLLCATGRCSPDVFHKGPHVAAAPLFAGLGTRLVSARAFQAACLHVIAWLIATALCWLLKGFFRRPRPASVLCTAVGANGEQQSNGQGNWRRRRSYGEVELLE